MVRILYIKTKNRLNNNKKMKKRLKVLLIGSLVILSFSCYYDEEIDLSQELPDIPDTEIISFSADIEPLFTQNGKDCTVCHNGTIANPDLSSGSIYTQLVPAYVVAGDAEASELYQKLPGNNHPIDAGFILSLDDIALIKTWIDRGAENN
jgi:hypothetical protein